MRTGDLMAMLRAYRESRILLTAIELDLFSAIEGGATAAAAAARTGGRQRAIETILNALVSMGLIEKSGATFLNTDPASRMLAGAERQALLHEAERWHTWSRLTQCVRGEREPEDHRSLSPERHAALIAMLDRKAALRAPKLVEAIGVSGVHRVLDLGGGSGAYAVAFVRAGDEIEAHVLELPAVAKLTREYVARAGEEQRVHIREGDLLLDPLGSGYDLILMFSLAHLFSETVNRDLLLRCHRALREGGRLAIHDHILAEDKTRPREGVLFAVNMLVASPGGATYSFGEYSAWLHAAGFSGVERRTLDGEPTGLLIATR